jgi:succinate dehydrogenase / fumarate reductase cytochrome b subunit
VFLLGHLALNTFAIAGDAAFGRGVRWVHSIPALWLLETIFIFAPLSFHGFVGLWLALARRPLTAPTPYSTRWRTAMRTTGVVAGAFLLVHLPELRWRALGMRLDGAVLGSILGRDLSSTSHGIPWAGLGYLLGTACVVFHFCTGLWAFLLSLHGSGSLPTHRTRSAWALAALGAAIWIGFVNVVILHATGAALLGTRAERLDLPGRSPCPALPGSNLGSR